jgi:hypothetical protein
VYDALQNKETGKYGSLENRGGIGNTKGMSSLNIKDSKIVLSIFSNPQPKNESSAAEDVVTEEYLLLISSVTNEFILLEHQVINLL